MDHAIPKKRGGGDELTNLVPCCRQCNSSKGNQTADEFIPREEPWSDPKKAGTPLMRAIGGRIREARVTKGMSQSELAKAVNVSLQTIGNTERGVRIASALTFRNIAKALAADENWLILRYEDPPEN